MSRCRLSDSFLLRHRPSSAQAQCAVAASGRASGGESLVEVPGPRCESARRAARATKRSRLAAVAARGLLSVRGVWPSSLGSAAEIPRPCTLDHLLTASGIAGASRKFAVMSP